jgi:hypothetical protein
LTSFQTEISFTVGDGRQVALTTDAVGALERDEDALVGGLGGADPRLCGGEVARRVHHVVGRDVPGRLELQRREERVRERRGLLIAHAERVGVAGGRHGEHDEEQDHGDN